MANLDSTQAMDPGQLALTSGPASQAVTQPSSNESSSSKGDLSRSSSFLWTLHGSCPRCHHWHNRLKLRLSLQPGSYNPIRCAACSHKWFGLGGNATHISLLSRETISIRSASWPSPIQTCTDGLLGPVFQSLINTSSQVSTPGSPAISEQSRHRGSGTPATIRRASPLTQLPLFRPPSRDDTAETAHQTAMAMQDTATLSAPAPNRSGIASIPVRQPYTLAGSSKGTTKRFQPLRKGVKAVLLHFGYTIQRVDRSGRPLGLATEVPSTADAGVRVVSAPNQTNAPPPESTNHYQPNAIEGSELTDRGVDRETHAPESSSDPRQAAAVDPTAGAESSETLDFQLPEESNNAKISEEIILSIRRAKTEAAKLRRKCECSPRCHCKKRSSSTEATVHTTLPAEDASPYHSSSASAASSEHCTPRPRSAESSLLCVGRQFLTPQDSHGSFAISEEERGRERHLSDRASSITHVSQATTLHSGQSYPGTASAPTDVPSEASTLRSRTDELFGEEGVVDGAFEVDGESTLIRGDSGADVEEYPTEDFDRV